MTLVPGKERVVTKKGGVIMINKTPKPIHKLHAMVNQKIFTEKIVNPKAKGGKTTEYKATYQKARPFPELEEEEVVFSTKQGSEVNWTGEKILGAFVRGEKK
jgi:ubiquinone/menaquinone biosynthesis C-methylase UbiE